MQPADTTMPQAPPALQQQQQMVQPSPAGRRFHQMSPFESTRLQPLPYRGSHSQRISTTLLPLQRAYPAHQISLEPQRFQSPTIHVTGGQTNNTSEHMLRRKTPNGTLAAGYDGTPVQWSTKPPAAKHVVLPMSRPPIRENSSIKTDHHKFDQSGQGIYDTSWPRQSTISPVYGKSVTPNGVTGDWTRLPPFTGASTSTFERIPMNQAPAYFLCDGNAMQVPTVLQPPYQSCSGPTSSNDRGLYGPYWPDGKFVPYRPAATRHIAYHNTNKTELSQQKSPNYLREDVGNPQQNDMEFHNVNDFGLRQRFPSIGRAPENGTNLFIGKSQFPGQLEVALPEPGGLQSSRQRGMYNPTPIFNGKSQNAQFKEKALAWAHNVYVELLAYLQHTRRSNQHPRRPGLGRSYSQASIYPKPPRQSSFSSVIQPSIDHHVQMEDRSAGMQKGVTGTARRSSLPLTNQREQKPSSGNLATIESAKYALEMLTNLCRESGWRWIDGMLLGGCLAYGLEDYHKALDWYTKIVSLDPSHVEGMSNLAATLLSLNRREEAEQYWLQSVKLRPSYFEAAEHLIGLLCAERRGAEAVGIIEFVERSLRISSFEAQQNEIPTTDRNSFTQRKHHRRYISDESTGCWSSDHKLASGESFVEYDSINPSGFGSSGYAIPGSENGRMLALVHAKGNMLYALGDVTGAEHAFEDAVLIGAGTRPQGIRGLILKILNVLSMNEGGTSNERKGSTASPLLLPPDKALRTAKLAFTRHGELPGLRYVPEGIAKNAAISTTSNSLLSLAKIFQDGMSNTQSLKVPRRPSGVGDILALYYLSLSLQPSPSTANNVGILLASVQQTVSTPSTISNDHPSVPTIPGVVPGSGIALALAYYNYGLNLDSGHAHLYTNLGSLLKDIGQLTAAIKMYEKAVACDGNFDIALANLANAVKDQGRISDAIEYYKRAVASSPDFAEAVCGLANALNSVCDWTGRGGILLEGGSLDRWHVDDKGMLCDAEAHGTSAGWMKRVVEIVGKQLEEGANWGRGILQDQVLQSILRQLEIADSSDGWPEEKQKSMQATLGSWAGKVWEGARIVRLVERAMKRAMHRWYRDKFILKQALPRSSYSRPQLPAILSIPGAPTVLPFHTFTCPLSAKDIRMISQRNALRISCSTLRAPWLPSSVYTPPPPPRPNLNIGYVSSDFNNHPLAHLMQSVFGLHDCSKAKAFCYATTASDHSVHREQIEREAPVFRDASSWSSDMLIQQIVRDEIHILVNLNGYTRGARNEVFAARPAPIQMSFMGFAGTLGAEWCDYLLADETAIPPETLRPWRRNVELEDQICDDQSIEEEGWVYSENIIFCRDTFFCCDHRQSSPDPQIPWEEEQKRRWVMRKDLFPNLSDDAIILGNFNQLYKIEPTTFRTWLRILARVPKAILWLLRFPDLGESNLKRTARLWAGEEVASRIWFTDVAPKNQHISRARVCDLFLDTPECNAHTTAADVLWSATPLLTLPRYKYKMCSRMAASILKGALPKTAEGKQAVMELIAVDENQYEQLAVKLASGLMYDRSGGGTGRLNEIRKLLYESRSTCALFDTKRWVSDLELAYQEAWRRWVDGIGGDIYL